LTISYYSLALDEGHLLKFCEVEVLKVLEELLVLDDLILVDFGNIFVDRAAVFQVFDS